MKHFFVFRMPMLVAVLMIMAACTIELARPVASHAGSAKKGGPKNLAEPFRMFSLPEEAQSAYTVRDGTISFLSQTPVNKIEATNQNIRSSYRLNPEQPCISAKDNETLFSPEGGIEANSAAKRHLNLSSSQ